MVTGKGLARTVSSGAARDYIQILSTYIEAWNKLRVGEITTADVRDVILQMEEL